MQELFIIILRDINLSSCENISWNQRDACYDKLHDWLVNVSYGVYWTDIFYFKNSAVKNSAK